MITTGGLCHQVNILNVYPEFKNLGPWVALMYTNKEHRNKGLGKRLLGEIERYAHECGLTTIYLYSFTAVELYKRSGWESITTVRYKDHDTVIMKKEIG